MSRIFDALKRLEGDRPVSEDSAFPEGPDLLRRAERLAISSWEESVSPKEREAAKIFEADKFFASEVGISSFSAIQAASLIPAADSSEQKSSLLKDAESISISLSSDSRLVCLTDWENPTAEALRLLTVRLRDLRQTRPLKKLLITSTIPREGKTTIAANLACALVHGSDEKILLIEGDVRLPALQKVFGTKNVPGICELLHDGRSLPKSVYHLDGAGLWMLPAGRAPANPLEILESQKLPGVMDQLAASFDWIIIDSPPVLPLADTSIWMGLADGVLLVTRQGVTEKQQLTKGLEAIESSKLLGALLNGSIASAYSGYYYRSSRS
jgi:capsular exopolysaccharide synthesis family protein